MLLSACANQSVTSSSNEGTTVDGKASKADSTQDQAYLSAIEMLESGDLDQAKVQFESFRSTFPEKAGVYANLALIEYKQENYDAAMEMISQAIKLKPDFAEAYQLRGLIYQQRGKIHPAKEDFQLAIKIRPDYANAQYNLALLYDIYLQEIALAVEHYEQYLALSSEPDKKTREWVKHLKGVLGNE